MNWDTDSILRAAGARLPKEAADGSRRARKRSLPTKHQRRAAFDIVARRTAGVLRLQIAKEKLPDGEYIYTVVAQGTGYGRISLPVTTGYEDAKALADGLAVLVNKHMWVAVRRE
jgi:hypothetical protein